MDRLLGGRLVRFCGALPRPLLLEVLPPFILRGRVSVPLCSGTSRGGM